MTLKQAMKIIESRNGLTTSDDVVGTKEDYTAAFNLLLSKNKIMLVDGAYYLTRTGVNIIGA